MDKRRRNRIDNRKKLIEWGKQIRNNGKCEVCLSTKFLDAHHILPKERWPEYKFELWNGICLCKKHHKFGKFSAHKNPIWFAEWLKQNNPNQYIQIEKRNIGLDK